MRRLAVAGVMLFVLAPLPVDARVTPQKPSQPPRPQYVAGEILVRFQSGSSQAERARVRSRYQLEKIQDLPLSDLELDRIRGQGTPPDRANSVSKESSVRYSEPNFLYYADEVIPTDPEFSQLWGLKNTGQGIGPAGSLVTGTADADIDFTQALEVAASTSGTVVGVIDTGVNIDHPDLAANIWTNPGEIAGNGIDDDGNGLPDDVHGWDFFSNTSTVFNELHGDDHGTHVAGTIAAAMDNGVGVAGVSQAKIMVLKFLGPAGGATADAIEALNYAVSMTVNEGINVRLTNNSWGGGGFSSALRDKIIEAGDAGQLFIAAAGNDGLDNDVFAHYPCSYNVDAVVCVAATNQSDGLASFSNYGDNSVDLGAPGVDILSTVPQFAKVVLNGEANDGSNGARSALHTFGLEGVLTPADRTALMKEALGPSWAAVTSTAPDSILIVDDDEGDSFQGVYQSAVSAALSELGLSGSVVTSTFTVPLNGGCTKRDGPTSGQMSIHEVVVWFVGADFNCTLNSDDQSSLNTYLGADNHTLLLFGVDIGFDLTNDGSVVNTFFRDTLKADYIADYDLNFRVQAVTDTAYEDVPTIELKVGTPNGGVPDGQTFSSPIAPRTGAVAGMRGAPTTWFDGTSMATPHVSGAVAQVQAAYPALTNLEVKTRLMDRGDPKSSLSGKTVSGKRLNLANTLSAWGALDSTFDLDGKLQTPIGSGREFANAVAVQVDDKIVVAGRSHNGANFDFAVARYAANGSLDESFGGGDGKVTTPVGPADDFAMGVAVDSANRIVVSGFVSNGLDLDAALVRYSSDGTPDTEFGGGDGIVTSALGPGNDYFMDVMTLTDSKILAFGAASTASGADSTLVRYNSDGTLDSSFGGGGGLVTTTVVPGDDVLRKGVLDGDGKIVAAGNAHNGSDYDFALLRYNSDGSLDSGFGGGDGIVTTTFGPGNDVAMGVGLDSSGKIVAGGFAFNGTDFDIAVARYTSSGALDTGFDGDGRITTGLGSGSDFAYAVAVQPDGKIVTAGSTHNGSNFDLALARYETTGTLDATFRDTGEVSTAIGVGHDLGFDAVLTSSGEMIVVGPSNNGANEDFGVARFQLY